MKTKKTWKKSSEKLIETFYDSLPDDATVERRKMFGYPCAFASGNMFTGLQEERMVVRLPEDTREDWLNNKGAKQFSPFPGRIMKEYIIVPKNTLEDRKELRKLVKKSLLFALSKPVKKSITKASKQK